MRFHQFLEAAQGITVYHGTSDQFTSIEAHAPAFEGGLGTGVYVGLETETADFYGPNVYELQTTFGWESILGIGGDSDNYELIGEGGDSIMTGEHVPPFSFWIQDKKYSVVLGSGWGDDEFVSGGEAISLEDIGRYVEEAGYKAVYVVGIRYFASVNEEMLVFNESDLKLIRQVQ